MTESTNLASRLNNYAQAAFQLTHCKDDEIYELLLKMKPLGLPYLLLDELVKEHKNLSNVELFKIATLVQDSTLITSLPITIKKICGNKYDRYLIGMLLGLKSDNIFQAVRKYSVDEFKEYLLKKLPLNNLLDYGSSGRYVLAKMGMIEGFQYYEDLNVKFLDDLFKNFIIQNV